MSSWVRGSGQRGCQQPGGGALPYPALPCAHPAHGCPAFLLLQTVSELLAALEAVWAAQPDCDERAATSPGDEVTPSPSAGCKRQREADPADSCASSAGGRHMPSEWLAAAAAATPAMPACSVSSSPGRGRGEEASSPAKRVCTQAAPRRELKPAARRSAAALAAAAADGLPFFSKAELQLLEECLLPGVPLKPSDAASAVGRAPRADKWGDEADSAGRGCRAATAAAAGEQPCVFAQAEQLVFGAPVAFAVVTDARALLHRYPVF